jgi:hypothetical protein
MDAMIKEIPKMANLKTIKQEIQASFGNSFSFHWERREYLIPELHNFINLMYSKVHFPPITVDTYLT